jgi:hypothetical protein
MKTKKSNRKTQGNTAIALKPAAYSSGKTSVPSKIKLTIP